MSENNIFSGQAIAERYSVTELLGRGGMGVVLRASDALLERDVALKLLNDALRDNPEAERIFLTEARSMATLSHANLVSVYDVISVEDRTVMVTEFIEGRTLESVIQAHENGLPEATTFQIGTQLCSALAYLHSQKIIHRDLKPANVMLQSDGTLKLIDFGLARSLEHITMRGTDIRGTPAYMAPEQIIGEELSEATDIYQIGVTLFETISGRLPFESGQVGYAHVHTDPPRLEELVPNIRPDLAELIHACLAKKPADRPESAAALAEALATQHQTLSGLLSPGSTGESDAQNGDNLDSQPERSRMPIVALAVLVIAILLAGGWLIFILVGTDTEQARSAADPLEAQRAPTEAARTEASDPAQPTPDKNAAAKAQRAAQKAVQNHLATASVAAEVSAQSRDSQDKTPPPNPATKSAPSPRPKPAEKKPEPTPSKKTDSPNSPDNNAAPTPTNPVADSAADNPQTQSDTNPPSQPDNSSTNQLPSAESLGSQPIEKFPTPLNQDRANTSGQEENKANDEKDRDEKQPKKTTQKPEKEPKEDKKPPAPFGF